MDYNWARLESRIKIISEVTTRRVATFSSDANRRKSSAHRNDAVTVTLGNRKMSNDNNYGGIIRDSEESNRDSP